MAESKDGDLAAAHRALREVAEELERSGFWSDTDVNLAAAVRRLTQWYERRLGHLVAERDAALTQYRRLQSFEQDDLAAQDTALQLLFWALQLLRAGTLSAQDAQKLSQALTTLGARDDDGKTKD